MSIWFLKYVQISRTMRNLYKFNWNWKKKKQQLANDFPIPSPKQECSGLKDCSVSQCIKSISAVADWPVGPSTANSTFVFVISIGLVTCLAYPALFIFLLRRYLKKIFFFSPKGAVYQLGESWIWASVGPSNSWKIANTNTIEPRGNWCWAFRQL